MAIKTQYEKEDEIPESLKEHAVKVDEKFVVGIEDIETHPNVNKLRNAFAKEKEKRDTQAQAIADLNVQVGAIPDDFDADRWVELKLMETKAVDPEKQKEAWRKELSEQKKAVVADRDAEHEIKVKELIDEQKTMRTFLEKTVRQDRLREGLLEAGVDIKLLPGAMALLQSRVKIVEENGEYNDVVEDSMGDISAKEYALQWVQKDEGKPYVKPASGPDLKGNKQSYGTVGDNPWVTGNLTQQSVIFKADRAKADRLMAQAKKQ